MKHKFSKVLTVLVLCLILGFVFLFRNDISRFVMEKFIIKKEIVTEPANSYRKDDDFLFVKTTDNFFPNNRQELVNVIYTFLNSGWNRFTFYCNEKYKSCQDDLYKITEEDSLLSDLNNYVHPYNSYQNLHVTINDYGKVTLSIDKLYQPEEIKAINQKIEEIKEQIINPNESIEEQIKSFHDYIIDHTVYDNEEANNIENNIVSKEIQSHKATNVLFKGIGLCGGYSDVMAIYLSSLGLPNYKIANDKHVWNFVKVNDKWYHIDLTWDDPVTADHQDILIHDFFLITTNELDAFHTAQHDFDKSVYKEAQ